MSKKITSIINSMVNGEKKYFIDGQDITQDVGDLADRSTNFYFDNDGNLKEKCSGSSVEFTGFFIDENGDLMKDGNKIMSKDDLDGYRKCFS